MSKTGFCSFPSKSAPPFVSHFSAKTTTIYPFPKQKNKGVILDWQLESLSVSSAFVFRRDVHITSFRFIIEDCAIFLTARPSVCPLPRESILSLLLCLGPFTLLLEQDTSVPGFQNVFLGPTATALAGDLWEMQIFKSCPRPTEAKLCEEDQTIHVLTVQPGNSGFMLKFENQ